MFAVTNACAVLGAHAIPVRVEANVQRGLPSCTIVGLRDDTGREARERIRCGLAAMGLSLPLQRVTVNLAPADLPKAGAAYDLAITVAILAAMQELSPERVASIGLHAEVGLDGGIRGVSGSMAAVAQADALGWREFIVGADAAPRAAIAQVPVLGARSLQQVVAHLRGESEIAPAIHQPLRNRSETACLSDVRGQQGGVRAVQVAAAGGHSLLLKGPPGCGKTMLASRCPGLLPPLDAGESLDVATIYDAAGLPHDYGSRPFRAPHHSTSQVAMVGGGSAATVIGEATLAHHGVLFLDELPEFRPSVLDALRQPLQERCVRVRRARWQVRFPARMQLVAAMNLCRCGNLGSSARACRCSDASRTAYAHRVSGALLDRVDVAVTLDLPRGALDDHPAAPSTTLCAEQVAEARQRQFARWGGRTLNAEVTSERWNDFLLDRGARRAFASAGGMSGLSGRGQVALVRVARTIADLKGAQRVGEDDVLEALGFAVREPELDAAM